jgi:hypothetical protein
MEEHGEATSFSHPLWTDASNIEYDILTSACSVRSNLAARLKRPKQRRIFCVEERSES